VQQKLALEMISCEAIINDVVIQMFITFEAKFTFSLSSEFT